MNLNLFLMQDHRNRIFCHLLIDIVKTLYAKFIFCRIYIIRSLLDHFNSFKCPNISTNQESMMFTDSRNKYILQKKIEELCNFSTPLNDLYIFVTFQYIKTPKFYKKSRENMYDCDHFILLSTIHLTNLIKLSPHNLKLQTFIFLLFKLEIIYKFTSIYHTLFTITRCLFGRINF